jgi:hypothetical protein
MSNKKVLAILAIVVVFAVVVGGMIISGIYNSILKPADFDDVPVLLINDTENGKFRHAYEDLNDNEKKVYSVIMQSIHTQPERIEIPALEDGDLSTIFSAISFDNPELFNLGLNCKIYTEGYKTYFEVDYTLEYNDYLAKLKEAKDIASVIIDGASAYTSVYEKEKYVHDYIVNHCTYTLPEESAMANTMYGCLVEGRAACEGYSRTFQYIMSALNIDNRLVIGDGSNDGTSYIEHMWNYVVLDGNGYFVDVTWDDPKTEGAVLRHTYLNVTTNDILLKHRIRKPELPLCTDTKYNYFVYENAMLNVGSGEVFESIVSNAVYSSIQKGYKCVELRFSDRAVMEQAKNTLFNTGMIYSVYREAGLIQDVGSKQLYYSSDDKMNTICLFF